jgi:hypothetical protein
MRTFTQREAREAIVVATAPAVALIAALFGVEGQP